MIRHSNDPRHHTDDDPAELSPKQARAGKTLNVMRYVLGISLAAVIVAFAVIYIIYSGPTQY